MKSLMAEVWNAALEDQEKREMKPREKLWASELGGSSIDLYLKLKGTPLSNPPNARSLRKFEAGNVFEWIVSLILKRANILVQGQKWCQYQYEGLLPVSGKADFIAGTMPPDFESGEEFIQFLSRAEIPEVFLRGFDRVLKHIKENHPRGIEEMPMEIKSVSSFAMDLMERTEEPIERHGVQEVHYLKAMGYPKGKLVYICRDDLRMMEFTVELNDVWEGRYKSAIERVSKFYYANEMPAKEPLLIFKDGRFTKNFNVEYSGYLTMLYGFKEPREYSEVYAKLASSWNRVLKRVKEGKKMTPKNEDVLKEIVAFGFKPEELAAKMPDAPMEEEELTD